MRKPTTLLLLALLAAAVAGNAQASSQLTTQATGSSGGSVSASATVSFRIVIREDLRLGGEQQKARPTSPQLTRQVSFENGREVVTLARP